ncbi:MAG: patatin-like phospholipase family protein [Piscinibacter sp.]|nr:patatin-like phospholipase family protein [Piscinibacter sp.]
MRPSLRPRLALVLGSGGVRSIAAVGITEVLAREGVRPDLVVGCSSGALFGATIAARLTPEEALERARTLWSAELTQQRRWRAYAQLVAPRWVGFPADFALRDDRLIAQRLTACFGERRLEDLPTPLRVAVTVAASGAPALLTQGRLVDALRASMAVPFLFPSVELDGRRLVDGVISDPLPVGAAADAQVVIALGFHGVMPRRVDRPSRLVAQVSTALTNNLLQARLAAARAAGQRVICVEPVFERHVGLWETAALPACYEAGRRAAAERLPQILALLDQAAAPVAA